MINPASSNRSWRSRLLIVLAACTLILLLACFYLDRIAALAVNHFTDYRLTYDKWGKPFNRNQIDGMHLALNDGAFVISAEKVYFDFKPAQLFKKGCFAAYCEMYGVSFAFAGDKNTSSGDNILAVPFSPDQKYSEIKFTLFLTKNVTKLKGFTAHSPDVRMEGDYTLFKKKDDILLDLKISFSPEVSAAFAGSMKESVLSADDDGWYSTVINYKGNAVFLRALYSIATPTTS